MNRKSNTLILGTLLTGLGAGWSSPAAAQPAQVRDLRILVLDHDSRQVLGSVAPGGTYTLEDGQRVRLRMEAELGGNRGPRYPSTRFFDEPRNNAVSILKANSEVGNVLVEANSRYDRGPRSVRGDRDYRGRGSRYQEESESIRWQVVETDYSVPRSLRSGSITLRVRPARNEGPGRPGGEYGRHQEVIVALYEGILLREPDASGARSLSDNIRRGGYTSLVESARAMAASPESRNLDRRDGASSEERLRALYDHLLGFSSRDVDRDDWARDLRSIRNGRISEVVESMVRSDRFRDRFDVTRISRY
jgi:hypothetical protein